MISPEGKPGTAILLSLSCWSESGCVAVGDYTLPHGDIEPLLARYTGSKWLMFLPGNISEDRQLEGVWCASALRCLAGGSSEMSSQVRPGSQILIVASGPTPK